MITATPAYVTRWERTVRKALRTGTLKEVGKVAAKIIQATDLVVVEDTFVFDDVPLPAVCDGWQISTCSDLLAAVSAELRKEEPDSLEAAICMIQWHMLRKERKEASQLAASMIPLYPDVPFLYFVASRGNITAPDALSYLDKGFSVVDDRGQERGYLRLAMLQWEADRWQDLVVDEATEWPMTDDLLAFLRHAMLCVEEYVSMSPLDARDRGDMLDHMIYLRLVVEGPSGWKNPKALISWLKRVERDINQADTLYSCLYGKRNPYRRGAAERLILEHKNSFAEWVGASRGGWKGSSSGKGVDDFHDIFANPTQDAVSQ
ncbi:hypothetical protein HK102_009554, partial [Quaeritorhiza haematococci]